jgi:hypothetical protein
MDLTPSPPKSRHWLIYAGACYVAMIAAISWALLSARHWALAELATPQSTAEWEAWRADVRAQQDDASPVRRAVPKSAEPPELVLMRDYFGVSIGGAILFSTVLFWICAWLLHGMLTPTSSNCATGGSDAIS